MNKLPINDYVWLLIRDKFGSNLRYVVPNSGTAGGNSTKWEISQNINFSPTFLTYDSMDDSYEFNGEKYTEVKFVEILNMMNDIPSEQNRLVRKVLGLEK